MHRLVTLTTVLTFAATAAFAAAGMDAASPAFKDGKDLPMTQVAIGNGCTGSNISPEVNWSVKDLPKGTRTVAVTMFDPDAANGAGYWHWIVYNIPPGVGNLPANAGAAEGGPLPVGSRQGINDAGTVGYTGACPPVGERPHRYILTVWALSIDALPAEAGINGTAFKGYLDKYGLGSKNLTAFYGRK